MFGAANWLNVVSAMSVIGCLYFILSFFQHLKMKDERLAQQSKIAAVVCLAIALLIPAIYGAYVFSEMNL
ncbi:hypothetical protein H9659_12010 [Sporosarcina sp. Sa3CUA8]|uniref:Uncharacterized protein n=2 Tax=Sporosarcina gallistercoris TaxID=2762245 RepID=A0ABR8PLJ5_9BACL|nr:hypothetical protein [Sporosarcina gallistercoris]